MNSTQLSSVQDYEIPAKNNLFLEKFFYYKRGSQSGTVTRDESKEAFKRYRLRPRILRNVSIINMDVTIQGYPLKMPVGLCPTGFHRMAHHEGEIATARGAAGFDTIMIVSALANTTITEVARSVPHSILWMNVYFFRTQAVTKTLVRNAEKAGCKALVVTMDASGVRFGNRSSAIHYMHYTSNLRAMNLEVEVPENREARQKASLPNLWAYSVGEIEGNHATIEDIKWLKSFTRLPIILKGVISASTARTAAHLGVDGIIVSAHGGRQLDFLPAPIDALPEVIAAMQGTGVEVYMDGGVRNGTDVLKALATGAKMVFVGRPILWGLATNGSDGVRSVLQLLKDELRLAMSLCGCRNVKEITPSLLLQESSYLASKL